MRRLTCLAMGLVVLGLGVACYPSPQSVALPTPQLSPAEMLKTADLVIEGRIIGVALTKRWTGTGASDQGYEQGDFRSWVLVSKVVKGPSAVDDTVEVFTHAYKEGTWADVPRFVYEGTEGIITPGNRVRLYLKWDAQLRRYERVHFNSGIVILEASKGQYPTQVGQPALWDGPATKK